MRARTRRTRPRPEEGRDGQRAVRARGVFGIAFSPFPGAPRAAAPAEAVDEGLDPSAGEALLALDAPLFFGTALAFAAFLRAVAVGGARHEGPARLAGLGAALVGAPPGRDAGLGAVAPPLAARGEGR